jgi:hypothetical protein
MFFTPRLWVVGIAVTNKRIVTVIKSKRKWPYWKDAPETESFYYGDISKAEARKKDNYTQFRILSKSENGKFDFHTFQLVLNLKGTEFLKILGSAVVAGVQKSAADLSAAGADSGINRAYYQGKVDSGVMSLEKAQAAYEKEISAIYQMQQDAANAKGGALGKAQKELAAMRDGILGFIWKGMELAKK